MFVHLLVALLFRQLIYAVQCNAEAEPVYEQTYSGVVGVLTKLQQPWPPISTVPPSNITGLSRDFCSIHTDCKHPRACTIYCRALLCCHLPYSHQKNYCQTSNDCEKGEFCRWQPTLGLTSGICHSSRLYQGTLAYVLTDPLQIPESKGLTGDRCFSQSNCSGTRSCLNAYNGTLLAAFDERVSVCTPPTFITCLSTINCTEPGEICASVTVPSSKVPNSTLPIMLPPLCLSEELAANEYVIRVSNFSSNLSFMDIAMDDVSIEEEGEQTSTNFNVTDAVSATPPFSVPPLSVFNSFTTNELANDYISGILSLLILSQLGNIFSGIIYGSSGIHYHGYSSYIIFSRLLSFRHLCRLIKRREPYKQPGSQYPSGTKLGVNLRLALLPLLALALLYVGEIGTIISGSQIRNDYYAERNFDPVISVVNGTPRPRERYDENCDDFFIPSRGLNQRGRVLKCVKPSTEKWDTMKLENMLRFSVLFNPSWTTVESFDQRGGFSAVELSTILLSASGNRFETRPIRFDLMSYKERKQFLNGFLNGIRRRLGYSPLHTDLILWRQFPSPSGYGFVHLHGWNDSIERITDAVSQELRGMDLVLNSTGNPWVLIPPDKVEQRNPWIAVMKPYRLAHGWLLIVAVLVTAVNVIVNTFATHFDDVAYTAMREMIGDVCTLGPLAAYEDPTYPVNVEDNVME